MTSQQSLQEEVRQQMERSMREEGLIETAPGLIRAIDPLRLDRIESAFAL
jgi:hypothetical protein